ncbi:response regulator [Bdellovibrio svalbardensis]|uniref:Response regulator n=1 Tax=Bdellovibrio svalbardensis TaxID=2972972 RepID=A0ABT6DLA7_9BACT|nr:response regulator [Bdellovibrio svalbardensis]MDG0817658.1 response regulator [Bdellovibrio svalbardensis]
MKKLANLNMLVVDDEVMIREILKDLFEYEGAKVFEASSGRKALDVLKDNQIDVLLTDVRMPDGDGITLAKNIHDRYLKPPKVFFLTGYSDVNLDDVKKYGVVDILSKPMEGETLIDRIVEGISHN